MEPCPLCRTPNASLNAPTRTYDVTCDACGRYNITSTAYSTLYGQQALAFAVAFWVSEQVSVGLTPLVDDALVEEIRSRPPPTVKRRAERYLSAVVGLLGGTLSGSFSPVAPSLLVASHSKSESDALALVQYWVAAGALKDYDRASQRFYMPAQGHIILDDITHKRTVSSQCFVAMSFNEDMNSVYKDGIQPAIEESGFEPLRLDRKHYEGKVDDEIIAEIRRSAFLVADFTEHRGGVYYEAGFAHGLGRRVIFTCRKDHLENLHFDVRQYNTITWSKPADLVAPLRNRILALFGNGPLRLHAGTRRQ